jgi:sigma-B regulation protein RsbU (phosphoserine phosphatase)
MDDRPSRQARRNPEGIRATNWQERLSLVVQMMRAVSLEREPQNMVRVYGDWVSKLMPVDWFVSVSRRDLIKPFYRITRSDLWENEGKIINPWKQRDLLPMFDRGILGELIYSEEPYFNNDFTADPADPAYEHLRGFRSMVAIPAYEDGKALNMTVIMQREPGAFDPNEFPERVWQGNLFSRATKNLVLSAELSEAYAAVERELQTVADIQRSLLPVDVPQIEGIDVAAYYQTSRHAGGDYYDFFPLDDGKLGILIADVSGHGTPAAVVMAVAHSIAHTREPPQPPCELLNFLNRKLVARGYTTNGTFITAFYGIYCPKTRTLTYSSAGHNPPRLRRCTGNEEVGETVPLDAGRNLPLGIVDDEVYEDAVVQLEPHDVIVLYTDGITEARGAASKVKAGEDELFGNDRLDAVVDACGSSAKSLVDRIVEAVNDFTDFAPPTDDRTLVVVKVR